MTEERISTYDIQRLLEYYQHSCRQPRRLPWHGAMDLIALEADVGPVTVKISKFREFYRRLTEDSRYRQAAWWWLHPHIPCYGLGHLSSIQQNAALDHVERRTFLRRLSDFCVEQQRKHGKLYGWIANRLALLEYELSPPGNLSEQLRDTERDLRFSCCSAINLLWQQAQAAAAKAQEISENALEAGASAVCDVLGKGKCRFSANLMVPVPLRGSNGPGYVPNSVAESNSRKARELWNYGTLPNICLLIVAETRGSSHSGFWVPLMRGEDDADLPGAAAAYYGMEANGVFKDDLPPLKGFQKHLGSKWHAYIRKELNERLFVSVPLAVSDPDTGSKRVIAVMNVNADPHPEDGWRRAYHREWLLAAQEAADRFIEAAFIALLIRMKDERGTDCPRLETGISAWDSLPGTGPNNEVSMLD